MKPYQKPLKGAAWLTVVAFLLIVQSCLFQTAYARPKELLDQAIDFKIHDWRPLHRNNFFHGITNYGVLGQVKGGSDPYAFWPAPAIDANGDLVNPKMNYVYGWGLWVGAQVRSTKPGKLRDTLCTIGYNPNNGAYEYTPGGVNSDGTIQDAASTTVKIYSSSESGWPLKNSLGTDSVVSVEDTWCQYNDFVQKYHAAGGRPLGIQVTQTTYQWNYPTNQDIIFFLFEVKNCGNDTLFDVYLAPTADCDIGNEAGTSANDVCFFDKTTNMAYQYQVDKKEVSWTRDAGCVGFMFLESPIANKAYTAPDNSFSILPGDTIGLFAFKVFNINIDPPTNLEQYQELAGYNYQTGEFLRFDPKPASGDQRFMESTGPIDMAPGSTAKTIVAVMCANFDYAYLNKNDTLAIRELRSKAKTAKLIYDAGWLLPGPPPSPKISLTPGHRQVIISWDASAEDPYDSRNKNYNYYLSVTSDSTKVNKFDPNFRFDTFQGYKLYKSEDGTNWTMLGQWDKDDKYIVDSFGIRITGPDTLFGLLKVNENLYNTTVLNSSFVAAGKESLFVWENPSFITDTRGSNKGLQYSYVDQDLINGFTYYYAVTSYGVNYQSIKNQAQDSIINKSLMYFETSRNENVTPVIPRSEPNDYVASQAWVSASYGMSYQKSLAVAPTVDLPRAVKTETYRQIWGPVTRGTTQLDNNFGPKVSYMVKDSKDSIVKPWTTVIIESDTARGNFRWNKEIKYSPGNYISLTNNIYNVNPASFAIKGTVPVYRTTDTISTQFITGPNMKWAFRSGRIEIRWARNAAGDTLFPSVWHVVDSVNNIVVQVPFDSTALNNNTTSGWNIGGTGTALGRRYVTSTWPVAAASYMNICGVRLFFNRGSTVTRLMTWANRPADGEVWVLNTSGITIPTEGEYQVINTSEYRFDAGVVDMGKVKVVPNPYIVRNIWERTNNREKLQFVNLPSKCTIKIFTIAGNLVKVLEHDDNNGVDGGTCWWDPMLTMNQQHPASGVYLYYVEAPGMGTKVGKFAIVR